MSAEQLKALFSQPLMLLALMFFAAAVSALKQLIVARRGGAGTVTSAIDYFCRVETFIMFAGVIGSWLFLIYTDTLNPASALGFGYVANDAADAGTKNGRSASIATPLPTEDPPK